MAAPVAWEAWACGGHQVGGRGTGIESFSGHGSTPVMTGGGWDWQCSFLRFEGKLLFGWANYKGSSTNQKVSGPMPVFPILHVH